MAGGGDAWGLLGWCTKEGAVQVELRSVTSTVVIRGFVANVTAKLVYHNTSSNHLQVECVLPVDEGAAVNKFEARLDGRTIIARCMAKKEAEAVYKAAVSAGQTAVLAREHESTSDLLHLALGNLPPDTTAELSLSLLMELKVQNDGGVQFCLPSVINPRYCPADVNPGQTILGPEAGGIIMQVRKSYTMQIEAKVVGGHDIARITSHTDPLNVQIAEDAKSASVTQDGGFKCDHDWSVVVYYVNPYKTHVLRETGDYSGASVMKDDLVMINLFPEVPLNSYSHKNEVIFIIDRSGSMQGEKMKSARATLLLFLKSLPIGCYFNVVSFGNDHSLLFPEGSREYSEKSLEAACALQQTMQANMGGTEIYTPFKAIFSKAPKPGYSRQILLISDGQVWNVSQLTELIGRHAHESRVFAVGIGHGASTALIHGVARAGRGRSQMVIGQEKLEDKVMGLVVCMVQESVQQVKVSCQVDPPTRVSLLPKVPPVIFGGQHLILYARLPPSTTLKVVQIEGMVANTKIQHNVQESDVMMVHDEGLSLHCLAARAQLKQWELDSQDGVTEDMIALSVASGVVCKRTALVGVDSDSGKAVKAPPPEDQILCSEMQTSFFGSSARMMSTALHMRPSSMMKKSKRRPGACVLRARSSLQPGRNATWDEGQEFHFRSSPVQPVALCAPAPKVCAMPCATFDAAPFATNSERCFMDFADKDEIEEESASSVRKAKKSGAKEAAKNSEVSLMDIIQLQKFDGSWNMEDVCTFLPNLTLAELHSSNTCQKEGVWATALTLAILEMRFSQEGERWALLAVKARHFIASSGEDAVQLHQAATSLIKQHCKN